MKKSLTRGEKWLLASPLLLLAVAGGFWLRDRLNPMGFSTAVSLQTLDFSPDGKRLLAMFEEDTFDMPQYSARVYDVGVQKQSVALELPPEPEPAGGRNPSVIYDYSHQPAWSPDGQSIASVSFDYVNNGRKIRVWDAASGKLRVVSSHPSRFLTDHLPSLRYSSDGKTLIGDGVPRARYDATNGVLLNKPAPHRGKGTLAIANEELGLVAVTEFDKKRLRVIDLKTKREAWKVPLPFYSDFKWSGTTLWVNDYHQYASKAPNHQNRLWLWNGKTRQPLPSPPTSPKKSHINEYAVHTATSSVAYFTYRFPAKSQSNDPIDGELVVFNYATKRVLWRHATTESLRELQWSPDGKWLSMFDVRQGTRYFMTVYDRSGKPHFECDTISSTAAWSSDSKQLAFATGRVNDRGIPRSSRLEIQRFG